MRRVTRAAAAPPIRPTSHSPRRQPPGRPSRGMGMARSLRWWPMQTGTRRLPPHQPPWCSRHSAPFVVWCAPCPRSNAHPQRANHCPWPSSVSVKPWSGRSTRPASHPAARRGAAQHPGCRSAAAQGPPAPRPRPPLSSRPRPPPGAPSAARVPECLGEWNRKLGAPGRRESSGPTSRRRIGTHRSGETELGTQEGTLSAACVAANGERVPPTRWDPYQPGYRRNSRRAAHPARGSAMCHASP